MARRIPSLNALRAFEAAGRLGRMTLAADELNVTHSAVSRQIQHLENVLGVPLFEGPKNKLRLTEAGTTLLSGLNTAFDQIDTSVRAVADTEDGALDVSCPGTFTMRWLIPRLYRFQAQYPDIDVRLTASSRPVDFARDSFDVAIRVGTAPWPAGADVIPLFPEQTGPVLAPSLVELLVSALPARQDFIPAAGCAPGATGSPARASLSRRAVVSNTSISISCWRRPMPGSASASCPGPM